MRRHTPINSDGPYGWGNTSAHADEAELFIRAHLLTGDEIWIHEIEADLQYLLGANPLNMSYMPGLGVREPGEILLNEMDALGHVEAPSGITIYGTYWIHDYGQAFYHDIMWGDAFPNPWLSLISESFNAFTVFVPLAEFTVEQGMTDTIYATWYLASLQGPQTAPLIDGTDEADEPTGTETGNYMRGFGGDDLLIGLGGSDVLEGGAGNDTLDGGDGYNFLSALDQAAPL